MEGISQEELAERINKSSHFVSLIERGKSGISVNTIIDICRALHTDTNSIFSGVIDNSNIHTDSFLNKSFNNFEEKDKEMVSYLINYIIDSKK